MITSAILARKLIDRLGSSRLKLLWDPCNSLYCNEPTYPDGYEAVRGGYLGHIHIKDAEMHIPSATVDFRVLNTGHMAPYLEDLANALRGDHYDGVISLESVYRPEGGTFEDFFLMGHDGPSNINVAQGRPRLTHLDVHHGKSGHGLGIDFELRQGPITLLNLTQFDAGDTFKLIYSVAEVVPGPILSIGNPNCRVRVERPMHEFMDAWCQQGPSHHIALGVGDHSAALETFAEAMSFHAVRV